MDANNIINNISVVIQGKVFGSPGEPYEKQLTLQSIESVRKHLPNAEIIISTWEGSDIRHLSFDKIVFSKDPGAISISIYDPDFLNNNNRQILSAYNGLKAATKKYAIKMRGDCTLINTSFLNYLREYPRATELKYFNQRIVIPTKYSRNPRRIAQLNHASDIFHIGLLEDLLNLWDIPLQPEPETTRAIPIEKRIINNSLNGPHFRMKSGPEQYIWYAFTKKQGLDLELKYFSNLPVSKIYNSEFSIINNFVIVESEKMGVVLPKRMTDNYDSDLYTHQEWEALCKKYSSKGDNKLDEFILIIQVYINNVKMIVLRVLKSIAYRSKTFKMKLFGINETARNVKSEVTRTSHK